MIGIMPDHPAHVPSARAKTVATTQNCLRWRNSKRPA